MPRIILFALVLFFSQSFGLENVRCGTSRFAENLKNPKKKMLAKAGCTPESYDGEVKFRDTKNKSFRIYYMETGPHAIRTNEYIDSLASYLEQAYKMHKNNGMKGISGAQRTHHYRQSVPAGLYPIEVIDAGLLRGYEEDEDGFAQTFGLTFPGGIEIIIENDFAYGADCSGNLSKFHFKGSQGVDYYEEWKLILKATVFHELYHAFQSAYYNWQRYETFWLEASATGVEEIGVPDADDYINYLQYNFRNPGVSMEIIESNSFEAYGWATLYLFLYSQMGSRFDSAIWNYFSNPEYSKDSFGMQLARLADSLNKNAEDLFHEYARQIFYSGTRAKSSPYRLFWGDMPNWPNWRVNTSVPSVLQPGTFDFIRTENELNTASVARKSYIKDGNNIVWVLSRLLEKEYVTPEDLARGTVAYPNPWNPRNSKTPAIHFKNLPKDSKGIEIRSANGALIARVDSLWEPKKIPAPGILYYRDLPYGKNKVLIVQY
ncbi:MAG: hypothetical protein LBC87_09470 [Fibromonadaceae bacterium]|jgi:hypothetical protein|nr:hypothetical protein [Fibromonadaceae bacterium]